ncbi:MAG: leucine-rich repeat protein [Barnesiella sp.]|nr:leucine-rich repeat protein [Barnesiella sp.]
MRNKILKYILVVAAYIICHATAAAQTFFSTDTLTYRITGENTVSVVGFRDGFKFPEINGRPSLYLTIPGVVNYDGNSYEVEEIENGAFRDAKINTLIIGSKIYRIGEYAFEGATFLDLSIPQSVVVIGKYCFHNCAKLRSIRNPGKSLSVIPEGAFEGCTSLTSFYNLNSTKTETDAQIIGPQVTSIGANAFKGCTKLTTVNFPQNIESIGSNAFADCTDLKRIIFDGGKLATLNRGVFSGCKNINEVIIKSPKLINLDAPFVSGATIYVDNDMISAYESSEWSKSADNIEGSENKIESLEPIDITLTYYNPSNENLSGDILPNIIPLDLRQSINIRARLLGQEFKGPNASKHNYIPNWVSSNPDVATINNNGYITGKGIGNTTITASFEYDYITYTKSVEIVVGYSDPTGISIFINGNNPVRSDTISLGSTLPLTAKVLPEGAAQKFSWSSMTPDIATVSENGVITPLKVGRAEIRATSEINENIFSTQFIEVCWALPTSIEIICPDTLRIAENENISYRVNPYPYASQDVQWLSSPDSIATVEQIGNTVVVTCHNIGKVVLSAMTTDSKHIVGTKELFVDYSEPASLTIETTAIDLKVDDIRQIQFTVMPATAAHKANWISNDESVATVDEYGNVKGVGVGTTTITGIAGSVRATCTVNVDYADPKRVSLNYTGFTLFLGESNQLVAAVFPSGALQDVTWTVDDETIATVTQDGTVTGVKPGNTYVLAKATANPEIWGGANIVVLRRENDYGDDPDNDYDYDAIDGISSDKFTTEIHESSITISGLIPSQIVNIFDLNGTCVFRTAAPSSGVVTTGSLRKGIYIVRVGAHSAKLKI